MNGLVSKLFSGCEPVMNQTHLCKSDLQVPWAHNVFESNSLVIFLAFYNTEVVAHICLSELLPGITLV